LEARYGRKPTTVEEVEEAFGMLTDPGFTMRGNPRQGVRENPEKRKGKRKVAEVIRYTVKDDLGRTYADREGTEDEARREARRLENEYGRKMHLILLTEVPPEVDEKAEAVAKALG
jgi:sarcosine oxidase delta subunit